MFTSHKQFKRDLKLKFNDKELPVMGSNDESVVLPVLDCLCSPKAVTPHTIIFSMHKKNKIVTVNAIRVTVTPAQNSLLQLITGNAKDLAIYLKSAQERATYLCVFGVSPDQLMGDYNLLSLYEAILKVANEPLMNQSKTL